MPNQLLFDPQMKTTLNLAFADFFRFRDWYIARKETALGQAGEMNRKGRPLPLGGAVTKWLVRWTPDRAVRVQPWPGSLCCVLALGKTFYSYKVPLHPGV